VGGLSEFAEARAVLQKRIKTIALRVAPRDDVPSGAITIDDARFELAVTYRLSDVIAEQFHDCDFDVEDCLGLRVQKQAAALAEVKATVEASTRRLGYPTIVDWNAWMSSAEFQANSRRYVADMRGVAQIPAMLLCGKGNGWSDQPLEALSAQNSSLDKAIGATKSIVVMVDPKNKTRPTSGKSQTLVPEEVHASVQEHKEVGGPALVLRLNASCIGAELRGCGRNVQFALTPDLAEAQEEAEIVRIANHRRDQELDRRQRERDRVADHNKRERESYARKLKTYQTRSTEKCVWCKGSRLKPCGNSGSHRDCRSCGGSKKVACFPCHETGLAHPNEKPPSAAREDKEPTFSNIGSIDFRRGI